MIVFPPASILLCFSYGMFLWHPYTLYTVYRTWWFTGPKADATKKRRREAQGTWTKELIFQCWSTLIHAAIRNQKGFYVPVLATVRRNPSDVNAAFSLVLEQAGQMIWKVYFIFIARNKQLTLVVWESVASQRGVWPSPGWHHLRGHFGVTQLKMLCSRS